VRFRSIAAMQSGKNDRSQNSSSETRKLFLPNAVVKIAKSCLPLKRVERIARRAVSGGLQIKACSLDFLLINRASTGAGCWFGTIPISCNSKHPQDNAFRVESFTRRPLGNSMYRRTNGPQLSSTYFEPTANRVGKGGDRIFSYPKLFSYLAAYIAGT